MTVLLVVIISIINYLIGYDISFSIFYLLPVALAAWFEGRLPAIIISFLSAVAWFLSDLFSGLVSSHFFIYLWNTMVRLGLFLLIGFFLMTIKKLLAREQALARTDSLTRIPNRRAFYERTQIEIERTIRANRPLSIAYIDVDNFKQINDIHGHSFGDSVLRSIAQTIKKNIRLTDIVSRFGGDEFVILMAETDEDRVKEAVGRVYQHLMEMIKSKNLSVTFSIGVGTWYSPVSNIDELIKESDSLMYSVKKDGKNMIKYKTLKKQTP